MQPNNVEVSKVVAKLIVDNILNSKYQFNPLQYGFVELKEDNPIYDRMAKNSFIKVSARSDDAFWYIVTNKMASCSGDDRWEFLSGVYSPKKDGEAYHHNNKQYMGCITSDDFAQLLLIHLLGTLSNEGTLQYGTERFVNDI